MTNNFENENTEDIVESEGGMTNEQGRKSGPSGNLAAAWRSSPLFKFTVLVVAVFAIGAAAVNFFGGDGKMGSESSRLARPPSLKEAPGGAASPYLRQQTEMANTERAQQAIASGGSAIPTPLGQNADVSGFGNAAKKEDPLKELRAETERLKKQVQQQQLLQQQQSQQQRPPEQFDNSLSQAMQRQMQQLLNSWTPQGIKNVAVTAKNSPEEEERENAEKSAATGGSVVAPRKAAKIIVGAGTVSYAQLLTEANSDVQGPILAQIVSGPLAGARAVGTFQALSGYEKYLVLKFNLADRKGKSYSINAIALDPDTTLGGMATEVDERYFTRLVLPAAAAFLQGLGSAMSSGNSTITTSGTTTIVTQADQGFKDGTYKGLSQAAQTAGQFFQQQANLTKPLIRVAAGTPLGMFFITPVREPSSELDQQYQGPFLGAPRGYTPTAAGAMGGGMAGEGAPGAYNSQGAYNVPYPSAAQGYSPSYGGYSQPSPYTQQGYGQ